METNIKRPPSVWITQIVLAFWGGLSLLLSLLAFTPWVIRDLGVRGAVLAFLSVVAQALFLLVPFWALTKRWRYAQLLGTGANLLLLAFIFSGAYDFISGSPQYDLPDDLFSKIAVWSVITIWSVLFVLLIWRLLFGSAANAFFAKPTDE